MKPLIQRTLVIIKPDAVKRGLVGEIISRFERAGLEIVALRMLRASKEQLEQLYPSNKEWLIKIGEKISESLKEHGINPASVFGTDDPYVIGTIARSKLIEYMSSGPIVALVLQGPAAVHVVRKLVGSTEPATAAPGTIRGDYSCLSRAYCAVTGIALMNVVHASDSIEAAEREIKIFFADMKEVIEV
ncbi:MAG: nucleoside-diphosphate kinase [bacterium]|nr:nucleoside-diphosphate kinase [bacterium]